VGYGKPATVGKLYVDVDKITGQDNNEPFAALYDPETHVRAGNPKETGPDRDVSPAATLQHKANGWSKAVMVELWGFEPQTSSMPWRRATSCAIAPGTGRIQGSAVRPEEILAQEGTGRHDRSS
jgi:hypothetical protein